MSRAAHNPPALLPAAHRIGSGLTLIAALISIVATLELVAVSAACRYAAPWPARLSGSITLATTGEGIESADSAAARIAETLAAFPGVSRAQVLEASPQDGLAARLMAEHGSLERLIGGEPTTARFVSVTFSDGAAHALPEITARLDRLGLKASLDDHGLWTGPLERTLLILATLVVCSLAAMSAGLWALVRTAARARVAARADRLRLLTHLGASEDALAKPFCTGLILAAALGSGLGMAIGLAAAGTLIWSPSAAIALATLGFAAPELHGPDLVGGLGWSPIAVLSAVVASLTGVRTALRRTV